jgi:hypothetical protein
MMIYEGTELIGFLFKTYIIVLFSGIIAIPFVPARIKPVISILSVFLVAIVTGILAVKCFTDGSLEFIINGGLFRHGSS